jgi:DNA polymerase epsilon subunit 1
MVNHLSGIKLKVLKLNFKNISDLVNVRSTLRPIVTKNKTKEKILSYTELLNPSTKIDMMDMIQDLREDDVPYHVRVCIDNEIRCGKWYEFNYSEETGCRFKVLEEKLTKADLRVLAFDIETTKARLKFPDSRIDSVMLISYMVDGNGFLITNRSIISEEIESFEYAPKPEFEGYFHVFNEEDEKGLLERFISHCRELRPNVFVTYNGDYFDLPFIQERMKVYNINMEAELGLANTLSLPNSTDREYMGRFAIHIDCLYWVKRDAFLPQGSHGLKAVTKAKLGYDPIEIDPEKMLDYAKEQPQQLCAYSVSDALATYYLYKLMIHDFIYALCTIIPTFPDEVLRKGSGTLCEELLMAQAFRRQIIFPNKQVEDFEKFFSGHLIDSETYIGGHVECLNVGVYRSDIPVKFKLDPSTYEYLIENIDNYIKFCLQIESNTDIGDSPLEDVMENYDSVYSEITSKLTAIIENINLSPNQTLDMTPLIYHLDVSAMYPNIILTNRLQPVAIVNEQVCAGCVYNREENDCKRYLNWKWRGELFPLSRSEYENLKHQYEFELLNSAETDKEIEELTVEDHRKKFLKRIKNYCQKVYKQVHVTKIETKEDIVCMRENSFYVDTVRDFRDRRYDFKNLVKKWKGKLEEAKSQKDFIKIEEAKNLMNLYESLQLAHKIILNSFYGYVMRKGARWYSMEMAAMVTHIGSSIITDSRELVERIGKPLELDTDGIWCLLPIGFPENFALKLKSGKKANLSFPCTMLNFLIYEKYCNRQYQALNPVTNFYETKKEMSIFFEVDGPYRCMVIPAAKEEGKMLKKRYAVFSHAGKLHELKGFELKRRGELKIIKIFQGEVFDYFLKGNNLRECYTACAQIADRWYSVLENMGVGITDEELLDYIEESKVMSKSVAEYGAQKSTSITCAKRLSEILGSEVIKDKGLCVKYIISKKPAEAPVAERAVPTIIFNSEPAIRKKFLRKWLKDFSLEDVDMREVIDWDYYKTRLAGTILKILIIPAALQKIENPLPKVAYPDWVNRMMRAKNDDQRNLKFFFKNVSNVDRFLSIGGGEKQLTETDANQMEVDMEVDIFPKSNGRNFNEKTKSNAKNKNSSMDNFVSKKGKIEFENSDNPEDIQKNIEKQMAQIDEELIDPVNLLEDFTSWLNQQKKKWKKIQLTNKRNMLATSSNVGPNSPQNTTPVKGAFIFGNNALALTNLNKNKEQSFKKTTLKILQIIEHTTPGVLKVWVSFDNFMECIYVNIKRKIYINSHKSDVPDVFKPVKLALPRNKPAEKLYEFDIDEKEFKEKFNNFNDYIIDPSIEGVYETKVPLLFRIIQEFGCQIKYVNKNKRLGNISGAQFNFEDFENRPVIVGNNSASSALENYLSENEYGKYYIYHSNLGARHFIALFLFPIRKINIYVVSKNVEMPNSKKIISSFYEKEGYPLNEIEILNFEINTYLEPDIRIVVKNINKILYDLKYNQGTGSISNTNLCPTNLIIIQSTLKPLKLTSLGFNALYNEYPVLEIPFHNDDNNYPALDWIKYAIKKVSIRYLELRDFVNFRVELSKYSNVPICNFEPDANIFCSDLIFSRMLKSHKQILWYSPSGFPDLGGGTEDHDFLGEVEYEFPKILNPGLYLGYSAEIDLGLFCVNAILESDNMKDITGKYELNMIEKKDTKDQMKMNSGTNVVDYHLERDEFVLGSNAFLVIKKMAEKWLSDVRQYENVCSDILLSNFYRWIASFNSKFFDPVIHRMINKLMYKYFSILVRKIKDFGFQIIYADYKKIFIFNNKNDLTDFQASLDYLFRTIKKIHIFNHITLTPNTFWKVILYKDHFNFAGINATSMDDEINQGEGLLNTGHHTQLKVVSKWTLAEFLPPILEKDFISLITDYLLKLYRFHYLKDLDLIINLHNLYLNSDLTYDDAVEYLQDPNSIKNFKQFLVNDYLSSKVFNMIPNILKKKDERYEDEELDNFEYLNLKDDQLDHMKDNQPHHHEEYVHPDEDQDKPLFSRKDFEDGDDYEEDGDDYHYTQSHNKQIAGGSANKFNKLEKSQNAALRAKEEYFKMWEFPTKLGSYQSHDNLALEYVKYISQVLSLDEDIYDQSFILKKNALKLIKIPEFSKETEFEDPCRTFILHDIICEYCATNKDLDFCRDKNILTNNWTCEFCNSQLDKQLIEYLIIHKLKNLIDFYYNQDLKCRKCKFIKNDLVFTRCICAGDYIKTFEESILKNLPNIRTFKEYLDNISNIANYYNFENLKAMLHHFNQ